MAIDELHVAVGVIVGASGDILIARRNKTQHQGDKWEFPGGKVESGEHVTEALTRELSEELGIVVEQSEPLIRIHYRYPDRSVMLDVWKVMSFSGEPVGREGQPLLWVAVDSLSKYTFPAANRPILAATALPRILDTNDVMVVQALSGDIVIPHDKRFVLVDADSCTDLKGAKIRLENSRWLGVRCNTLFDLEKAQAAEADFVVLPFDQVSLVEQALLPVYLLKEAQLDLSIAIQQGAQGVFVSGELVQ